MVINSNFIKGHDKELVTSYCRKGIIFHANALDQGFFQTHGYQSETQFALPTPPPPPVEGAGVNITHVLELRNQSFTDLRKNNAVYRFYLPVHTYSALMVYQVLAFIYTLYILRSIIHFTIKGDGCQSDFQVV